MSAVWAAVKSLSLGPLLVAIVAATAAVIIYYYVNRDNGEEMTETTEDTTAPVVFADISKLQLRVRVNEQTSRVELEGPEPTLTQLSTQVKEVVLPSAGLSSNVLAYKQNTPQRPTGLSTHQSGTSSSHATCETEEIDMNRGEAEQEEMGLFIPEPMLCCEPEKDKVPRSIQTLFQTVQCNSTSDCLLLAAHMFLLETGFLPQGCDVRAGEMPSGWKATEGLCRLRYFYPFCENSPVQMVSMLMGQTLIIKITIQTTGAVEFSQKLALNPKDYVNKEWAGGNAGLVYRDMQKLSRVFKDHLVYPLIARAREALGLPALFGLTVLPPELLLRIMRLLDVPSILRLSEVCRHLNSFTHDASLWKHFVYRDFGADTEHRDADWNELYKKKYQQKKAWYKYRSRFYASHATPYLRVPVCPIPPILPHSIIRQGFNRRPAILRGIVLRPSYDPIGPFLGYELPMGPPFGRQLLRPTILRAILPRSPDDLIDPFLVYEPPTRPLLGRQLRPGGRVPRTRRSFI
ncbi:F-box only protein 7-like isoform X2 [Tachysurus fulvidraco]|uniref:F-box only protein 7-like isoform X2 n=1 Tax=Tachysurus fulvidraco TaxID=1234273 RepID=UPI001FED6E5F|nr:F-box only protein 7-like isoform X2 [Tachysurus fulvidraco]